MLKICALGWHHLAWSSVPLSAPSFPLRKRRKQSQDHKNSLIPPLQLQFYTLLSTESKPTNELLLGKLETTPSFHSLLLTDTIYHCHLHSFFRCMNVSNGHINTIYCTFMLQIHPSTGLLSKLLSAPHHHIPHQRNNTKGSSYIQPLFIYISVRCIDSLPIRSWSTITLFISAVIPTAPFWILFSNDELLLVKSCSGRFQCNLADSENWTII